MRSLGHDENGRMKQPESATWWWCVLRATRKDAAMKPAAHARGAGGGVRHWRRGKAGEAVACRRYLTDAGGKGGPTLSTISTSVSHSWERWTGDESTGGREAPTHPYLVRQMSDFVFCRPLRGSNSGVHAKNSTSLVCLLANILA